MNPQQPKNIPASISRRLLNLARERGDEFEFLLTRYALERLLHRISISSESERFVLKGAMLFAMWTEIHHRATKDLDLLGRGPNDVLGMEAVFQQICNFDLPDEGLIFDPSTVAGSTIRAGAEYESVRICLDAHLGKSRIPIQVDIGFGDAVQLTPGLINYPTLLDLPSPKIRAYPREAVLAEKFEAMIVLGMANSRMKDFYDVWILLRSSNLMSTTVLEAVRATFECRKTPLPCEVPLALTTTFSSDLSKQAQWIAFVRKGRLLTHPPPLTEVVAQIASFFLPLLVPGSVNPETSWPPGGPWRIRRVSSD